MRKYPVLKCDNEALWKEIALVLKSFNIIDFSQVSCWWNDRTYIVSNYGSDITDGLKIGTTTYQYPENINRRYRYLVNTKEEFLTAIAKLLNINYRVTMEKRNIEISLEKAREWYYSNDKTLKELALQAYSVDELKSLKFDDIYFRSSTVVPNMPDVPKFEHHKWSAIHKLAIVANYLNDGWQPDWDNNLQEKWSIYKYDSVIAINNNRSINIGFVYFKSRELAEQAIAILGNDTINTMFS